LEIHSWKSLHWKKSICNTQQGETKKN